MNMPSKGLTEEEAQKMIEEINLLYDKFEVDMKQLHKKRNALIDEFNKQSDDEKIQKALNKLRN